ncbi:hypothetical protein GCM10028833_37820 [Glycomyces tarimensis]
MSEQPLIKEIAMRFVPAAHRRTERVLWTTALVVLVLAAVFMIGLWE